METEAKHRNSKEQKLCYIVPQTISHRVEHFFYVLGLQIARRPIRWIFGCSIFILICLGGLLRFRQEKNPLKLWVPPDSDFVRDTEWIMSQFKQGRRMDEVIFTADDILEPRALYRLNEVTKKLINARSKQNNYTWSDICFKVPNLSKLQSSVTFIDATEKDEFANADLMTREFICSMFNHLQKSCFLMSFVDIWKFDSDFILNQTKEEIVERFNSVKISPTLGFPIDYSTLLGGTETDSAGRIISAKAVKTTWMVSINFEEVDMDETGNDSGTSDWTTKELFEWEATFVEELQKLTETLEKINTTEESSYTLQFMAGRSFGDISDASIFQDILKLIIGVFFMSLYVQIILSKLNWVEWRFCLTSVALLCIGGAFFVAIGLCSLFGIPYGPVHTSLPFMLMGLGVDDTFVMMASWKEVVYNQINRDKSLHEKVALALSHAGAAISVTSFTDVVAFMIGASTILPSLNSFCIYAAVGVFVTYLLQVTLFVAFFTLDAERVAKKRNGIVPCIVHEDFQPSTSDAAQNVSWKIINKLYNGFFLTIPGKILIISITIVFATIGGIGSSNLEQWFDPVWFLPKDSYLNKFLNVQKDAFPTQGFPGMVFMSNVNLTTEFNKILNLTQTLQNSSFVASVVDWPADFLKYVEVNFEKDLTDVTLDGDTYKHYLSKFLFGQVGGKYQGNFRFKDNLKCGENTPDIAIATIDFTFKKFHSPYEWIPGMDGAKKIIAESGLSGFATVWAEIFATWVTDKVISQEVVRNIILALICVMATTAFMIAEVQTCFWILLCVLLTLLDVCGFMYYWGMTIDIVSCIGLELAVGLSVDYAAHVAHAFLNSKSPTMVKNDRRYRTLNSVRHIGTAVLFGAGSTLLALSFLSFSEAYVFRAFFKIFLLVIIFGLWHGLLLLPVILSTSGPASLKSSDNNLKLQIKDAKDEAEIVSLQLTK